MGLESPEGTEDVVDLPRSSPAPAAIRQRLLSGSFYGFVGVVVGQAFALLTSIAYARVLGVDDLGLLALYMQVTSLVVGLAGFALSVPATKFVAQFRHGRRSELEGFLSTVFFLTIVIGVVSSPVLFWAADYLSQDLYGGTQLALMIRISAVFLIFNGLSTISSSVLQGFQRFKAMSLLGIVTEVVTLPVVYLSLVAFGLLGAAISGALLTCFTVTTTFGYLLRILHREGLKLKIGFDRGHTSILFGFTLPLLLSASLLRGALLYQTSFLAVHMGLGDTGLFKVASNFYRIILFVPSAISLPLLPVASELYATSPQARTRRHITSMVRFAVYFGIPISLGIGFAAIPLIELLYGNSYVSAASLVFILAIAGFIEMVAAVMFNSVLGEGRTWLLLGLDGLQTAVIIIGTTLLVNSLGLIGVGFATLLNSAVYTLATLAILVRQNRLEASRIGTPLLLALGSFVVATAAMATGYAQSSWPFAIIFLAAYLVVAWKLMEEEERRTLLGIARMILRRSWS